MNIMSISTSGLMAAVARLNASASNTANSEDYGALDDSGAASGAPAAYQPVQAVSHAASSNLSGGVAVTIQAEQPSENPAYQPDLPFANAEGMVAAPNVDPVQETAAQIDALNQFKANLAAIRTADEMQKALMNLEA